MSINTVQYRVRVSSQQPLASARTVRFETRSIVLLELKRRIIYDQQWIADVAQANIDVQVSNGETGEEYRDDAHSIRSGTTLVVRKIAASHENASRLWMPPGSVAPHLLEAESLPPAAAKVASLLSSSSSSPSSSSSSGTLTPFERILAARASSTTGVSLFALPTTIVPPKQGGGGGGGLPMASFSRNQQRPIITTHNCHRCHKPGHFISQCPNIQSTPPPTLPSSSPIQKISRKRPAPAPTTTSNPLDAAAAAAAPAPPAQISKKNMFVLSVRDINP